MEGLAGILLQFGGPVLARALTRRFGGEIGELAQDALDALGQVFGVEPTEEAVTKAVQETAAASSKTAEAKITMAEASMAQIYEAQAEAQRAGNEQQKLTNELLQAQMKESGWRSDWLIYWQYFLMFAWGWTIVLVPVGNAALRIFATATSTDLITGQLLTAAPSIWSPDLGTLVTLTGLYLGLHMGGHTVLELMRGKWGGLGQKEPDK